MIEDYNNGLEFHDESNYSFQSKDNVFSYSVVISSVDNLSNVTSKLGVRCSITGMNVLLVAGGGATGVHKRCFCIENDSIYICVGDTLFCIENQSLALKWKLIGDEASCFQIIPLEEYILIHGELSVTAITYDGEIIWSFSGRDIFVTPDDTPELEFKDNMIVVRDWNLDEYILDLEGNLRSS